LPVAEDELKVAEPPAQNELSPITVGFEGKEFTFQE
jgi:hypothetical protein